MYRWPKFLCYILFSGFCFSACNYEAAALQGVWQADAFYQNDQLQAVVLDSIRLQCSENGLYEFHSTGFYHEKGRYRVAGKYLFVTDSTAATPSERAIKILSLAGDSLKLEMRDQNAQKQVLVFKKTG